MLKTNWKGLLVCLLPAVKPQSFPVLEAKSHICTLTEASFAWHIREKFHFFQAPYRHRAHFLTVLLARIGLRKVYLNSFGEIGAHRHRVCYPYTFQETRQPSSHPARKAPMWKLKTGSESSLFLKHWFCYTVNSARFETLLSALTSSFSYSLENVHWQPFVMHFSTTD